MFATNYDIHRGAPNRFQPSLEKRSIVSLCTASCSKSITVSLLQLCNEMETSLLELLASLLSRSCHSYTTSNTCYDASVITTAAATPRPSRIPCKWKYATHSIPDTHYSCMAANYANDGSVCRSVRPLAGGAGCLTSASKRRACPTNTSLRAFSPDE